MTARTSTPKPDPLGSLTPRQLEVLDLAADGLTNAEIGARLGISALTVKQTLTGAAKRLGTGSRAGMVGVAYRWGLLAPVPLPAGVRLPDVPVGAWAVLPLIARGLESKDIAKELGVTSASAEKRAKVLMAEFGVGSRAHLVRVAVDAGALTPSGSLAPGTARSQDVLPPRNAQALAMVAQGMSDAAVGRVLGVSEQSAGNLVRGAVVKLRAANRAHAVFIACGLGLLRAERSGGRS